MGEPQVDQNQLEQIGSYVKNHIGQWIREQNILLFPERTEKTSLELMERIVTIEQQLKFQNDKLEMMMDQSDKRFQSMDKRFTDMQSYMNLRFEGVEKRFNRVYSFLTAIFITMLGGFISLLIKVM